MSALRLKAPISLLVGALALMGTATSQGRYMEQEEFLKAAFPGAVPVPRTLWITNEIRDPVEALLGHSFGSLRVRYWAGDGKTAWVFDEIGKEKPITIGVTVRDDAIEMVRILEFRETRGWEVRYPFFTDQFVGARFVDGNNIDKRIDSITGATLSVAAVTRVVHVALLLNDMTQSVARE
jgi:hypothetical protein